MFTDVLSLPLLGHRQAYYNYQCFLPNYLDYQWFGIDPITFFKMTGEISAKLVVIRAASKSPVIKIYWNIYIIEYSSICITHIPPPHHTTPHHTAIKPNQNKTNHITPQTTPHHTTLNLTTPHHTTWPHTTPHQTTAQSTPHQTTQHNTRINYYIS